MFGFFNNKSKILKAHKERGYPKLNFDEQINVLLYNDFSRIQSFTDYLDVPKELLNYYIFLNENDLAKYFLERKYFEDKIIYERNLTDGFWFLVKENSYVYIEQERGKVYQEIEFKTMIEMLSFVAKKILQKVPKYNTE